MKLYFLASYIHLFKAISYVIWLNVLLQLVNFVIEEFMLWNMTLILFSSNILCWPSITYVAVWMLNKLQLQLQIHQDSDDNGVRIVNFAS
jgi:hypothetical protein